MTIFRTSATLVLVSGIGLASCTDSSGFNDNKNAIGGAGVGALAGAILGGAVAKDDAKGRRLGAIVGGIAGGALGARLDEQERALNSSLGGSGAMIQNTGEQLIVTLPESITFDLNSDVVKPRFVGALSQLAQNLNQYPNSIVEVTGHTDNTGTTAFNQDLSVRRARSVASILISNGVAGQRVSATGVGEFAPAASNATAAGRQANRRVVITITPTG